MLLFPISPNKWYTQMFILDGYLGSTHYPGTYPFSPIFLLVKVPFVQGMHKPRTLLWTSSMWASPSDSTPCLPAVSGWHARDDCQLGDWKEQRNMWELTWPCSQSNVPQWSCCLARAPTGVMALGSSARRYDSVRSKARWKMSHKLSQIDFVEAPHVAKTT